MNMAIIFPYRICKKALRLHERYGDLFIELAKEAVTSGAPIIRPLWWMNPEDSTSLSVDDEFMVGNVLLVAPVLEPRKKSRNVYLPRGRWKDHIKRKVLKGGRYGNII